jgi:hypothetical protein
MGGMLLAFLAEVSIITYRDLAGNATAKTNHTIVSLPLPADYLAAIIIFGALGAVPKGSSASTATTLFGWGIVTATLLNLWSPTSPFKIGVTKSSGTPTQTAPTKQGAANA